MKWHQSPICAFHWFCTILPKPKFVRAKSTLAFFPTDPTGQAHTNLYLKLVSMFRNAMLKSMALIKKKILSKL